MKTLPDSRIHVSIWLVALSLCAFLPGAYNRWVLPKEVVLLAAVLLATFTLPRGKLPKWMWWCLGAGTAVLLATTFMADAPLPALFGRLPRYEGLVSLPVYAAAAWLGARVLGPGARDTERLTLGYAFTSASALIAIVSLAEVFGARPIGSTLDRPGSLLGNATDQGLVGAVLAVLLLALALGRLRGGERGEGVLLIVGSVAGVVTVASSASRAGFVALAVGALVVGISAVVSAGPRRRRRVFLGATGAVAAGAGLLLLMPMARERLLGLSPLAGETIADRFSMWTTSAQILGAHPVLGVGPSGFLAAFATTHDEAWTARADAGSTLDSPHSVIFQVLLAGGWLGAAVVLAAVFLLVRGVWPRLAGEARPELIGAVAGVTALGAGLLTHFTVAATGILGGFLVGILVAGDPVRETPVWRRVRSMLVGLWIAALAVTLWGEVQLGRAVDARSAVEADEAFGAAAAVRPWDVDALSLALQNLTTRAEHGDAAALPLALAWGERASAALPDDRAVLVSLGLAQRQAGEVDAALATLTHAAGLFPHDPVVQAQWGATQVSLGDESGVEALRYAESLDPENPDLQLLLEWAEQQFP